MVNINVGEHVASGKYIFQTDGAHGLSDNDTITLSTTGSFPTGLDGSTTYYVFQSSVNAGGVKFMISTSSNPTGTGDCVTHQDNGTGQLSYSAGGGGGGGGGGSNGLCIKNSGKINVSGGGKFIIK